LLLTDTDCVKSEELDSIRVSFEVRWFDWSYKENKYMCESNVYMLRNGKEELVLADVASIEPKGDSYLLRGILGNPVEIKGKLLKLDFMAHKVILIDDPAPKKGCCG
jgi:predicted RNA-binding protein